MAEQELLTSKGAMKGKVHTCGSLCIYTYINTAGCAYRFWGVEHV